MASFTLSAEKRADTGKGASRRLRRANLVPAIMYGKNQQPENLTLKHDEVVYNAKNESFYSSILTVKVGNTEAKAILRDLQRHPFRPIIMHMDFQRINENEKLHMRIPLHFKGGEAAPGLKNGGLLSHVMTDLMVNCFPRDLPEFIEVDVSGMNVGDTIHISDIKFPANVESVDLGHGAEHDLPVVTMHVPRVQEEDTAAPVAPAAPEATAQTTPTTTAGGDKK